MIFDSLENPDFIFRQEVCMNNIDVQFLRNGFGRTCIVTCKHRYLPDTLLPKGLNSRTGIRSDFVADGNITRVLICHGHVDHGTVKIALIVINGFHV